MRGMLIPAKFMNRTASFAVRTGEAHEATVTLKISRIAVIELVELRVIARVLIVPRSR
jgi:hypothetical protein